MAVEAVLGVLLRVAYEVQVVRSVVVEEAGAEIRKSEAATHQRRLN